MTGARSLLKVLALLALSAAGAACGGGSSSSASSSTTGPSAGRPSSTATLAIVSPANGSVVHGSTVDVRLSLEGARIVKTTSTDLQPDEGHVHLLLDGTLISMNYGLTDQVADVSPGHHLLQAEFVATDHAPFDPRVIAVSSFTVRP